jgi:hypothetical protein
MLVYAKAIVAAVVAGGGVLGTALADGTVTPGEWLGVALAALAALGVTAAVPNKGTRVPSNDQTFRPGRM